MNQEKDLADRVYGLFDAENGMCDIIPSEASHVIIDRNTGKEIGLLFRFTSGLSLPFWYAGKKTKMNIAFLEV
jgi:hypothetical protein